MSDRLDVVKDALTRMDSELRTVQSTLLSYPIIVKIYQPPSSYGLTEAGRNESTLAREGEKTDIYRRIDDSLTVLKENSEICFALKKKVKGLLSMNSGHDPYEKNIDFSDESLQALEDVETRRVGIGDYVDALYHDVIYFLTELDPTHQLFLLFPLLRLPGALPGL